MKIKSEHEADFKSLKEGGRGDVWRGGLTDFAQEWAEAMEVKIASGSSVEEAANTTIGPVGQKYQLSMLMFCTGYQVLCRMWAHGEELKAWGRRKYPDVEV